MNIQRINTRNLPHRGDSVTWNGCVHLSGIMPSDETASIAEQTADVLREIEAQLANAGTSKAALISATVWLADLDRDFEGFNAVWRGWVDHDNLPARACVQAKLHGKGLLEIAAIAATPPV